MTNGTSTRDAKEELDSRSLAPVTARERFEAEQKLRQDELELRKSELKIRAEEVSIAATVARNAKAEWRIDPIAAAIIAGAVTIIMQIITTYLINFQQTRLEMTRAKLTNELETLRAAQTKELETIKQQGGFVIEAIKTGGGEGQHSDNARNNLRLLAKLKLLKIEPGDIDSLLSDEAGDPLNIGLPADTQPIAPVPTPPDLKFDGRYDGTYMVLSGQIVEALDGDSLTFRPDNPEKLSVLPGPLPIVLPGGRIPVRLDQVDAPELSKVLCADGSQGEWGHKARLALSAFLRRTDPTTQTAEGFGFGALSASLQIGERGFLLSRQISGMGLRVPAFVYRDDQRPLLTSAATSVATGPALSTYDTIDLDVDLAKQSLNYYMVAEGHAARQPSGATKVDELFREAERAAVTQKMGFWSAAQIDAFDYTDAKSFMAAPPITPYLHRRVCSSLVKDEKPANTLLLEDRVLFSRFGSREPIRSTDLFDVSGSVVRIKIPPYELAAPEFGNGS